MNIAKVEFFLITDEEKIQRSYAQVNSGDALNDNGMPAINGVVDLRMGTTSYKLKCVTCGNDNKQCLGHEGTIKLNTPILNPLAINEIRQWLKVLCHNCGGLLFEPHRLAGVSVSRRLNEGIKFATDVRHCPHCKTLTGKVRKVENVTHASMYIKTSQTGKVSREYLYPYKIKKIFAKITNETLQIMGRNYRTSPVHYCCSIMNVPPTTIRPSMQSFNGTNNTHHDFTNIIQHIVKSNNDLSDQELLFKGDRINHETGILVDTIEDRKLQTLYDFTYWLVKGATTTTTANRGFKIGAKPLLSITREIPGKKGLLRGYQLGKRTISMARSTISCNSSYKIDEIGIPLIFARTLQREEVVQHFNIEFLMTFILNGTKKYPGYTMIVKGKTGARFDAANFDKRQLEIGDIVYRDLIDGDEVYFNRQPTANTASFGVHRVHVIKNPNIHTLQFNVSACHNYHADFDGDQMNLIPTRCVSSCAEAKHVSGIRSHFISVGSSGPMNGQVQDAVVGCYYMTRPDVVMDKFHAAMMFSTTRLESLDFENKLYTGYDIVSLSLTGTPINYSRKPFIFKEMYAQQINFDDREKRVEIVRGKMKQGVLDYTSIGITNGSIYHIIAREYGKQEALDAIFIMQQISIQFLMYHGFTSSIFDLLLGDEAIQRIKEVVEEALIESEAINQQLARGEIVSPIGMSISAYYEKLQMNALKPNDTKIMNYILREVDPHNKNGFFTMIGTKAKGNDPNFINICGVVGNVTINDSRMPENFSYRRVMAYYQRFTMSPFAYGFVPNSYMAGTSAVELFHQARLARFTMISGALFTAITGYFLRKGTMNHQATLVNNARQSAKDRMIVQYMYGDDGLDPRELEKIVIKTIMMDDETVVKHCVGEVNTGSRELDSYTAAVIEDRDFIREILLKYESANAEQQFTNEFNLPVNVERLIDTVFVDAEATKTAVHEPDIGTTVKKMKMVEDFCERLQYVHSNKAREISKAKLSAIKKTSVFIMQVYVRAELYRKTVLERLSVTQLEYILDYIKVKYIRSLMSYGTTVGIIAAQYITGPLTQGMLDARHKSASGGAKTSGMTKVNEIYQAKKVKDEHAPSMTIHVNEGLSAKAVAMTIEYLTVKLFVKKLSLLVESPAALKYPQFLDDKKWMDNYFKYNGFNKPNNITNFCVRLVIDKTMLILKLLSLDEIILKIKSSVAGKGTFIVHTQESSPEIIIRIWLRSSSFVKTDKEKDKAIAIAKTILECPIRGCNRILHTSVEKQSYTKVDATGKIVREEKEIIITTGTNMYELALHNGVDRTRITSNSVDDTYTMLGVAAARNKIITETAICMGGEAPSYRHLQLYADEMCRIGNVSSYEKGGLAMREKGNACLLMCNSDPLKVVTTSALTNAKNKVYGTMTAHLMGMVPQIGTKYNKLCMDSKFIKENYKSVNAYFDEL